MRRKVAAAVTALITLLTMGSLAGCGSEADSSSDGSDSGKQHIYVLTAPEDHGWTGAVATFAKEKIKEVNADGKYSAELITSANASEQITKVEDIISKGEDNASVVIQPIDDTVQSAIQQLADADIPYVAFDRIIDGVSSSAVANVKGDNSGIGSAAAAYFVSKGLKPGEKIYVYEGDTSSVTTLRNQGFTDYLTGKAKFEGKTIDAASKWTDDQLKSITYSGSMNWSRSDTKTSFESLMGDSSNANIKWFYAQDDELTMGILEALNGGGIDDATKKAFLANHPVLTGCGGLKELYSVLAGEKYQDIADQLGGLDSVTYSPAMIQTAIQDMVDHLDGKTVKQDHVIACENVTADNVKDYPSF
ncbi:substrate-binding domain-containing protein [Bifidobacterium simiarum]|uniref:substrate-binding domain-containing protein n=1 Tax=Bifidobacterium simiarum TaxID=2045441 RepID=UPI001BDD8EFD|nr:substrate-binding domain-containing protein [Bifidobacterium simiarum]MBT1166369.1 substrate-binding domain-containing protein [Bifidobacterium simiarum]